jgi:hypothetical protein
VVPALPAQQEGTPIPGKFDKNKFGDLISRMKIPTIKIDYLKNAHLSMHALKDRISVPDIQVEWRELGECFLLALLSIVLYVSVVLAELAFIPIMIIVIKRGWKEALIYLGVSTFLLFYMMVQEIVHFPLDNEFLLLSPTHYSFSFIENITGLKGGRFLDFFFIYGCFGIFLGYFISRNYKLNYVVFFSLAVYSGIAVLPLLISGFVGGFHQLFEGYERFVNLKTASYVDHYLHYLKNYSAVLTGRGIEYNDVAKKVEMAAEIYRRNVIFGIAPRGGYLIKQIVVIFVGIGIVRLYFKRRLSKAALSFSIKNYRIGDSWVWAVIISWGIIYINLHLKSSTLGILSWNAAVIFSFLFFIRGLALIKVLADRIRMPQVFQYLILLFFLFYSFIIFVTIVTGIGVADIWLKAREHLEKKNENRSDS